jgi:bifunctional non-homologous end joining protein LigD
MLNEYQKKRNFKITPEPSAGQVSGSGPLSFVVQKHNARRLHYDFRLELDGVLKSWALPNGPSLDPQTKRLAVMVEDHPLDYRSFEGVIPAGEYGAGQVIVWDQGTYSPVEDGRGPITEKTPAQEFLKMGLAKGKISFRLKGQKLKGSWALVKMQRTKNDWLLIKHQDEFAESGKDIQNEDTSVISGNTIEDFKKDPASAKPDIFPPPEIPGARVAPFPSSISPMLATLVKKPFSDPAWLYEPKLDGYRTLAYLQNGRVKLLSRRGLDVSSQYPDVVKSLSWQPQPEMVLDGEIVALDAFGRTCFQCLQNRLNHGDFQIIYYVFDILYLGGKDLRGTPLIQRKNLLEKAFNPDTHVRLVDYFENDAEALYQASLAQGLEGILAKLKNSAYEDGLRSKNWLKIKATLSDEFIICGYTAGVGNRAKTFGALVLGSYNDRGQLVFAGHVGSGFDDQTLASLRQKMDALRTGLMPLAETPVLNGAVTWVKPEIIAEVKFAERTQEGLLRAPVFLRLREDKSPSEVRISETPPVDRDRLPEKRPLSEENPAGAAVLAQLAGPVEGLNLEIEGRRLSLTNLDKALWPAIGKQKAVTKRDLLVYLSRVSPYFLPHLKDRPLTLTRYPQGISGEHFYQKHAENAPGFVQTASLSEHTSGFQDYLLCNNLSTLLWLGQLANIDIHTWFSRITPEPLLESSAISPEKAPDFFSNYPDFIIFDLDPYIYSGHEPEGAEPQLNRRAFEGTCQVALWLKEVLASLSLNSFVKTSGRTGLHVFAPIVRQFDFSAVHSAARTISTFLFQKHPQEITLDWAVAKRTGKIFLDYNQNARGKTLASIYSPRPSPQATVSTPLLWSEIGKAYPTDFTIFNVPERLSKTGDIWSDILAQKTDLSQVTDAKHNDKTQTGRTRNSKL